MIPNIDINLSLREIEILELIIEEYTTPEIALKLHLSSETVKTYRRNLLHKLKVRNVAGMVRRAFEWEIVREFNKLKKIGVK